MVKVEDEKNYTTYAETVIDFICKRVKEIAESGESHKNEYNKGKCDAYYEICKFLYAKIQQEWDDLDRFFKHLDGEKEPEDMNLDEMITGLRKEYEMDGDEE